MGRGWTHLPAASLPYGEQTMFVQSFSAFSDRTLFKTLSGFNSLWKISSETYVIQKNSPHPTVPLKSNDKRAVFTKINSVDTVRVTIQVTI